MTIKEDMIKPDAPTTEQMYDRREEATIATETTESTNTTKNTTHAKIPKKVEQNQTSKGGKKPGVDRPMTRNEDLCCQAFWEGCIHCCTFPCVYCCCCCDSG